MLRAVLAPGPPIEAADAVLFWAAHRRALSAAIDPWEAAVRGGASADRLGYAFLAGYEAALGSLLPGRDRSRSAALCATERGGAHPRAIAAVIEDGALSGEKTYVTLGEHAEELYVLARTGTRGDRAELALARVPRAASGVLITPLPAPPFVPEIPHAAVRFEGVRELEVLPGDGWADYVRPFRTVEDVHVHAAVLAWLAATAARHAWPRELPARALSLLLALRELSRADPSSPAVHVALAGAIALSRALVSDLEPSWEAAPSEERARWQRDRGLLEVAGKARALRLERAWQALSSPAR